MDPGVGEHYPVERRNIPGLFGEFGATEIRVFALVCTGTRATTQDAWLHVRAKVILGTLMDPFTIPYAPALVAASPVIRLMIDAEADRLTRELMRGRLFQVLEDIA